MSTLVKERIQLTYYNQSKPGNTFHSHSEYEIYFFHGGKCTYLIGDQIYSLSPGDLIIMHGLTLHCPRVFEGKDYIRSTLLFDSGYFQGILKGQGMEFLLEPFKDLQSYRLHLGDKDKQEMETLLRKMNEHNKEDDEISNYRLQFTFIDLLAFLYSRFEKTLDTKKENRPRKEEHVQRIVSFIEKNYMDDINLQRLEDELHMSKFYLSKVFKDVTGFTIFNYLFQRRINQAKIEFITSEDQSITDVSYKIGFKHPAHFSKVFKQLVGYTPEQYKKNVVAKESY
ncbi:AraC family transcriptional regulator [Evansella sp. AB-P1]|uniref:AraC family transcriptional regulator n=1 Tax=Evansella sp. AB-P1 TaxID=3037653 RepID=UPI00241D0B95|nr:AraC family transcriptional regulator [Evansella sp. AB-P1]MDG5788645.1 AraC family transcriptional regulator [Evansella sp. AB-P1]